MPLTSIHEISSWKNLLFTALYLFSSSYTFIHFLKEKPVNYKGTQQKFYLFKIQYGFDAPEYLAIAGPYSLNAKDISSSHEATGVYWEKSFDAKKTDAYLQEICNRLAKIRIKYF